MLVTIEILALAMLDQPLARVDYNKMFKIASAAVSVSKDHSIDPVLLGAIALIETGGRNLVMFGRGRKGAGADVGVFQIHCPRAGKSCIDKHSSLKYGARRAAEILVMGKNICSDPPIRWRKVCSRGFWACYNPGSKRWSKRLMKCYKALKRSIRSKRYATSKTQPDRLASNICW